MSTNPKDLLAADIALRSKPMTLVIQRVGRLMEDGTIVDEIVDGKSVEMSAEIGIIDEKAGLRGRTPSLTHHLTSLPTTAPIISQATSQIVQQFTGYDSALEHALEEDGPRWLSQWR